MNDLLPSYKLEESESDGGDALPNGHLRVPSDASKYSQGIVSPLFPEVEKLLSLFKDSCKELLELRKQVCLLYLVFFIYYVFEILVWVEVLVLLLLCFWLED